MGEFMINFENRFKLSTWIEAIDFTQFHISGGCVVNCLCKQPFPDTATEPVDVNFNGDSLDQFDDAVAQVFANLTSITLKNGRLPPTLTKKNNGVCRVTLSPDVALHFNFKYITEDADPISYVLHSSDLDVSQAAFTGQMSGETRKTSPILLQVTVCCARLHSYKQWRRNHSCAIQCMEACTNLFSTGLLVTANVDLLSSNLLHSTVCLT